MIEPNLGGIYGYTEDNTLGRLIGWIAATASLSLLLLHLNVLTHRQDKALLLDVSVYGLAALGIGFGLLGAVFAVSPGFFHSIHIRDWNMRVLEGFYAIGGAALIGVYSFKRGQILRLLLDDDDNPAP